jgi:hypothetical protein
MGDKMETRDRPIKDWFAKIRTRQIMLPRFQRFEAWGPQEISSLLTSVIRDLPIGVSLILGVGDKMPFVSRPIVGAPGEGERINELLLDGQQRLTGLWRSLKDDYMDKTYLVDLEPSFEDEEEKLPMVIGQTRWHKNDKKYPLWVDSPKDCWKRKCIPVQLLDPDDEKEYLKWADEASEGDIGIAREIERAIVNLRGNVSNFNLPLLFLPLETPPDVAIDVFIKLNTNVVPLKPFDIVVAQMEEATGESLHEFVDSIKGIIPRIGDYTEIPTFVLSLAALLQGKIPSQKGYKNLNYDIFLKDRSKIIDGSTLLVRFLEEERVIDKERLPTESILPPLAALLLEKPQTPDEGGNIRVLLRKYLWRSFFTERYDKSVPTVIFQDYRSLKKVINNEATIGEVPIFDQSKYPSPEKETLLRARWPTYRDRLARAILLLSLRGGAEDIAEGNPISSENIAKREYHHLFPVAWLREKGMVEEAAYTALNCILIKWKTNRVISSKEPLKYLRDRCEASTLGENEIRRRLRTHFVDFDILSSNNYLLFLEKRAEDYEKVINELFEGKAWHPGL